MLSLFCSKVELQPNGCWNWLGYKKPTGYGTFYIKRKPYYAHRISYMIHHGLIPKDKQIDHLCRNTSCVNPKHMEVVTCKVNLERSVRGPHYNTLKTHCLRGHELTEQNVKKWAFKKFGHRSCKICGNELSKKAWRMKAKEILNRS